MNDQHLECGMEATENEKIETLIARIRAKQDKVRQLTDQLVVFHAFKRKHGFCPSTIATMSVSFSGTRLTTKDGKEHFMDYDVRKFLRGEHV